MLEIKNLYVEGKGHAQLLRGVSFSMKLGECIGLTGPSGAGKTTIIKAIMGVLDHTCRIPSGDILLDGVSLPAMPPAKRRDLCGTTLGFIPQNPMTAFDPHIRMGRLMEETFCLRLNCSKPDARKLAADTLRRVNLLDVDRVLSSYPRSSPAECSKGSQWRFSGRCGPNTYWLMSRRPRWMRRTVTCCSSF